MARNSVWARKKARRALVQAVYQWQMTGATVAQVQREFEEGESLKKADVEFFADMLKAVSGEAEQLDQHFASLLDRKVSELDKVELAILRLGTNELLRHVEVPFKVVIDEYVELTKTFGAEEAHKYVNGVLDKLAQTLRPAEAGR